MHHAESAYYLVDIGGCITINLNTSLRQQQPDIAALDTQVLA
jgi:hypothetical protein